MFQAEVQFEYIFGLEIAFCLNYFDIADGKNIRGDKFIRSATIVNVNGLDSKVPNFDWRVRKTDTEEVGHWQ